MLGPATPCEPWITEEDLCCPIAETADPALVASAITASIQYLYDRTCRRWPGTTCTARVRPCLPCECCGSRGWYGGETVYGSPLPWSPTCGCRWRHFALQAPYPILEIIEFEVNGVDETADVRLDNNRDLALLASSARGCFPMQSLDQPDGTAGTWSVLYRFGAAPLELAKIAAADLACQLIKDCVEPDCENPDNVESISKRGVTVKFRLPSDGVTNVRSADLLINEYQCQTTGTSRIIDPSIRPTLYRGTV